MVNEPPGGLIVREPSILHYKSVYKGILERICFWLEDDFGTQLDSQAEKCAFTLT